MGLMVQIENKTHNKRIHPVHLNKCGLPIFTTIIMAFINGYNCVLVFPAIHHTSIICQYDLKYFLDFKKILRIPAEIIKKNPNVILQLKGNLNKKNFDSIKILNKIIYTYF